MTEQEVIKEMMGASVMVLSNEKKFSSSMRVAMKALEDVQQNRAIGTVDECRVAVEKQKPMKPLEFDGHWYKCPKRGKYAGGLKGNYCHSCGQAIDWSDL